MTLLSIHPFSLYTNGGGGRVLRRLYEDHEHEVISLALTSNPSPPAKGSIQEIIIPIYPLHKKWMRWHLRTFSEYLRKNTLRFINENTIQRIAQPIDHNIVHLVAHGPYAFTLYHNSLVHKKKLWVSFHDHFSTNGCSLEETELLWNNSDRRLVISPELGNRYQQIFKKRDYELITDGVAYNELSPSQSIDIKNLTIYFAGLLHIDYIPLFLILANSLDLLSTQGYSFTFILRGTQQLDFLRNRLFKVEYRENFISDVAIKEEIDSATLLYLPIKFSLPDFYLYSLSTKMVSYMGGAGTILYHGPGDSAACRLLQKAEAAVCCTSMDTTDLAQCIKYALSNSNIISTNAKNLAADKFNIDTIQKRFWQLPLA